jgi:hypothetical protein
VARHQQLSNALKRWWKQQTKWKDYKSFSKECKIPVDSLKKYFYGAKWPRTENLEKLYSITGLDILKIAAPERTLPTKKPRTYEPSLNKKKLQYAFRTLERLNQEVARVLGSLPPAIEALTEINGGIKQNWVISTITIQLIMDALERSLRAFLKSNEGLQILRKQLRGADAGYLSGLLSSIFDDQRLSTWKQMTTYKYGSKNYGN